MRKLFILATCLLILTACIGHNNHIDMNPTSKPQSTPRTSPQAAENRLREHIEQIPPSRGSRIARVPNLDILDMYAFSVLPSTGLAGEVIYLVGAEEMMSSGVPSTFETIMARVEVGKQPDAMDIDTFARFFLRLRVHRRGIILYESDQHPLVKPNQFNGGFVPPVATYDESGADFQFWVFDTDRFEPIF